ncbi:MAG: serine/threonine-protein kinase [Polyangiaceae bacterium]|jgi:serine/threonine protein kinase
MAERADPFEIVQTRLGGKYYVARVIGETSLSVVYRAEHSVWKRSVAIKAFKGAGDLDDDARTRLLASFIQEGALLAELSERSTAICQAHDVGSFTTAWGQWVPYMVLEWIDGEALDVVMERDRARGAAPLTDSDALALLCPVADALALAHARGIVHCDVKPGNVLILRDAEDANIRSKLLDFGFAKVLRATRSHTVVERSFTPSYGAPEQWSSEYGARGPATDVFALALIFVELVTGRDALHGDKLADLGIQCTDRLRRPTPRTLGATVSDEVERVLARALAVDPANRFADARQFKEALEAAIAVEPEKDEHAVEAECVIPLSRRPARRRSAVATALVACTCAVVGWQLSSQSVGRAASFESFPSGLSSLPTAGVWTAAQSATASMYASLVATVCAVACALCIGTLFSVSWLGGRARMMADGPEIGRLSMQLFRRWTVPSLIVSLATGAAWCAFVVQEHHEIPWVFGVALEGLALLGLNVTVGQRVSRLAHGNLDATRGDGARRFALLMSIVAAIGLASFQPSLLP